MSWFSQRMKIRYFMKTMVGGRHWLFWPEFFHTERVGCCSVWVIAIVCVTSIARTVWTFLCLYSYPYRTIGYAITITSHKWWWDKFNKVISVPLVMGPSTANRWGARACLVVEENSYACAIPIVPGIPLQAHHPRIADTQRRASTLLVVSHLPGGKMASSIFSEMLLGENCTPLLWKVQKKTTRENSCQHE